MKKNVKIAILLFLVVTIQKSTAQNLGNVSVNHKTKAIETFRQILRIGFEYVRNDGRTFHRQLATVLEGSSLKREIGKDAFMFDYFTNDMFWVLPDEEDRFVITSVPFANDQLALPLGVVVSTQREVTFMLDDFNNFDEPIYIFDNVTGNMIDLKEDVYKVIIPQGEYRDRFSIIFSEHGQSTPEQTLGKRAIKGNESVIRVSNKTVEVVLKKGVVKKVELYSLTGDNLLTHKPTSNSKTTNFDLDSYSSSLYLIKITTDNGIITKKIVI